MSGLQAASAARRAAGRAVRDRAVRSRTDRRRNGRSYAFSSLLPVHRGKERALARTLRAFGTGRQSPLARLPYLHFGRWVVIDDLKTDWPGAPRPEPRLKSQYLLFTADVTAPGVGEYELPRSFIRELRLRIPDDVDAVWDHCIGYPGTRDAAAFDDYFLTAQLETLLYYAATPDVTVQEINEALTLRDELISFARTYQGTDAATLRLSYVTKARSWFPSP